MRLQEVYTICQNALEIWPTLSFSDVKSGVSTYYKIQNPDAIRSILSDLEAIGPFEENISAIRRSSAGFLQHSGDITVDQHTRNAIVSEYQSLESKVTTITGLFDSIDYAQDANGFDIKLPPDMSLSELSKCAKDLDTIFSTCPLFSNETGTITFSAVDVGSIWLSFIIGGTAVAAALRSIAELVDKVLIIRSHRLTVKEQEEKVRGLTLGNDLLEKTVEVNKAITDALMEKVSSELAQEHAVTDPEDQLRLKHSLQLLSDWMEKGMEIYPSTLASPEIKAVFPPIERQALPEIVTALLTSGSDTEE